MSVSSKFMLAIAVPAVCQIGLLLGALYVQHEAKTSAAASALVRDKKTVQVQYSVAANDLIDAVDQFVNDPTEQARKQCLAAGEKLRQASPGMRRFWDPPAQVDQYTDTAVNLATNLAGSTVQTSTRDERIAQADRFQYQDLRRLLIQYGEQTHHWRNYASGSPEQEARIRAGWMTALLTLASASLIALLAACLWFYRDIIYRFARIMENIVRFASEKPLQPIIPGSDEISRLDHAFHDAAAKVTKATENERLLTENASDVICSFDEHGRFLALSKSAESVFGYTADALVGKYLTDIVSEADHSELIRILREISNAQIDTRVTRKDGIVIDIDWNMNWSDGESAFFCVARDITERKQSERFREDVVRMVSHDLRSPLTGLQMVYEMLQGGVFGTLTKRGSEGAKIAIACVERLLSLVSALLETERIRTGMLSLEIESTSLHPVFEKAAAAVQGLAAAKDISINVTKCDITIEADQHRLLQLCTNLIRHVIAASPARSQVSLKASLSGPLAEIVVAGEGHSIRDDELDLSLAMAKDLATLHGGSVHIAQNRVSCRLPLLHSSAEPQSPARMKTRPANRNFDKKPEPVKSSFWERLSLGRRCAIGLTLSVLMQLSLSAYIFHAWQMTEKESYVLGWSKYEATGIAEVILKEIAMLKRVQDADRTNQPVADGFYKDAFILQEIAKKFEVMPMSQADRDELAAATAQNKQLVSLAMQSGSKSALADLQPTLLTTIQHLVDKQAKLSSLEENYLSSDQSRYTSVMLLVAANLLALLVFAKKFGSDLVRRTGIILQNVSRFERGESLPPPLPGSDELAQLDEVFHSMAKALQSSREKQHAMIAKARDVLFSLDLDGTILSINDACSTVFGSPPEQLIGSSIKSIIDMDIAASGRYETITTRPDGSRIDLTVAAVSIPGGNKIVCVGRDVSEQKDAQRLRHRVAQIVADELQIPLNAISKFHSDLASSVFADLNEEGRSNLQIAQLSVERMLRLVNDLLDLDRLETGTLRIEKTNVSIDKLVSRCVQSMAILAQEAEVTLNYTAAECNANVDPERICQVLFNLIGNALKFTPPARSVSVSVENGDHNFKISVADQGRGIPPEALPFIFDRFQQVESADSKEKGGSGLGLAICKALIELHEGTISVQSEVGYGTCFTITLPHAESSRDIVTLGEASPIQSRSS